MRFIPQLSIRTTLLVVIGVLNLLIIFLIANAAYSSLKSYHNAQLLKKGSYIVNALYETNRNLSLARAAAVAVPYADAETAAQLKGDLVRYRTTADTALDHALRNIDDKDPRLLPLKKGIENRILVLKRNRTALDAELMKPQSGRDTAIANALFVTDTALIQQIQSMILVYVRSYQSVDAAVNRQLLFKNFVWKVSEFAGQEYALIGKLIAEDKLPDAAQTEQLTTLRMRIEYGWEILREFSLNDDVAGKLLPYVDEAQTHYFMTFDQIKDLLYAPARPGAQSAGYPISIEMWLGMAAQAVDSLLSLQSEVMNETQRHVIAMERSVRKQIMFSTIIFFSALMASLYCWGVVVFRIARPINEMIEALYKATREEAYEMPKLKHRKDEIGKLMRVLEVFQDNAARIKRSNEELERFAFIAAHDLKSPLRAIDNLSQWLEEDLEDKMDADTRKHMDEIRKRVHLMERLLDDTLEYAHIDSKRDNKSSEIISGGKLIEEIIGLLELPAGFTIKTGENLARLRMPKLPIQQVLYNLINNAIKHHDKDHGTIVIDAMETDAGLVFSVRDDGPGIAPQYHQKIFEMFQTLKPKTTTSGRGMGLAFVRKIITGLGGDISVHSDVNQGTEFRFTWPRYASDSENKPSDDGGLYG